MNKGDEDKMEKQDKQDKQDKQMKKLYWALVVLAGLFAAELLLKLYMLFFT